MILITVVDDDNGLTFNHRRQSKDRMLRQHILQMVEGKTLWMDSYSVRQFEELPQDGAKVDDDYFAKAAPGDFCFMERMPDSFCEGRIEQLILFRWNCRYPGDSHFEIVPKPPTWVLVLTEEFAGSSHEKITKEVWNHAKEN